MPADRRRRCVLCAGAALPWIGAAGVADARAQGADEPLARIPAVSGIVIREVEITSGRRLRDRDGQWLTESDVASRYDVRMVPHLELVDARGERLVKPLIGLDSAGFYESSLQNAIAEAARQLGQ